MKTTEPWCSLDGVPPAVGGAGGRGRRAGPAGPTGTGLRGHRAAGDYSDVYTGKWIISFGSDLAELTICCHDAKRIMMRQTLCSVVNSVETEDSKPGLFFILFLLHFFFCFKENNNTRFSED